MRSLYRGGEGSAASPAATVIQDNDQKTSAQSDLLTTYLQKSFSVRSVGENSIRTVYVLLVLLESEDYTWVVYMFATLLPVPVV